ncbi:hypothetical protein F7D01_04700 [Erythrobacter sp. 3-20A1M]|uniref:hypothetical protein n=1 Tax=Erythrobacter sp. 3-20A1M TaxID=2653850 RepID=UPI001BFC6EC4|nr:hypothetical protein [Erythrobacter sp. 3-20A1M]QWC56483.1 hypothetical protein F7D01_04700 [Erythrobacter sp. 3-20A1M]
MQDEHADAASFENEASDTDVDDADATAAKSTGKKSQTDDNRSKTLSASERRLRHIVRMASKFPNGPEAKELASMEKPMPANLREKIRKGGKYELWSEAFGWLAADLHRKARSGTQFYPKAMVKKLRAAYPELDLRENEISWLEGWIGYLGQFRTKLRSGGSYGPGIDLLVALDVERDIYGDIDSLDIVPGGSDDYETSLPVPAQPGIEDLPSTLREMPFRFTELNSSTAKTFWRAYRSSNDIESIRQAGLVLASDPWAKDEMERLGKEAETFFIETMAKLRIPLS